MVVEWLGVTRVMAKAEKGSTEKIVTKTVEVVEHIPTVTLTLSLEEAQVVLGVLSRVGGTESGLRGLSQRVHDVLHGLYPQLQYGTEQYIQVSKALTGHLMFKDR